MTDGGRGGVGRLQVHAGCALSGVREEGTRKEGRGNEGRDREERQMEGRSRNEDRGRENKWEGGQTGKEEGLKTDLLFPLHHGTGSLKPHVQFPPLQLKPSLVQ